MVFRKGYIMLNKLKTFFIGFFSILWVSMIASFLAGPKDIGGAEINDFLAFVLWILFVYLAQKICINNMYCKCQFADYN